MQLSRHKITVLAVLAVGIVGLLLVVPKQDEADAAIGVPDWLYDISETAYNTCVDVPQSIVQGISNTVNGGMIAAGGGLPGKATVTPEAVEAGAYPTTPAGAVMRQNLAEWLQASGAMQTTQGATNAEILAAVDAWAPHGAEVYGITQAEIRALAEAALAGGATVSAPTAFVGSAGATAVAVDGAAVAGTSVAGVGGATTGGTVAGAGATLSASTVGLAAAVAVGGFCGTINASHYLFGDAYPNVVPAAAQPIVTDGLHTCTDTTKPGYTAGDICTTVSLLAPALVDTYVFGSMSAVLADGTPESATNWSIPGERYRDGSTTASSGASLSTYQWGQTNGPNTSRARKIPVGYTSTEIEFDCADNVTWWQMIDKSFVDHLCGLNSHAGVSSNNSPTPPYATGTNPLGKYMRPTVVAVNSSGSLIGRTWLDAERESRGVMQRLVATVTCKSPVTMSTTTVTSNSRPFFSAEKQAVFDPKNCSTGTAPVRVVINRETKAAVPFTNLVGYGGAITDAWSTLETKQVLYWEAPTDVQGNATTLACLAVGATVCPLTPDGSNVRVGGPSGLAKPASEPRTSDLTRAVWESLEWPVARPLDETFPEADPDPDPGPTTTTIPGGSGGPPGDQNVPPADPPGPPEAPPPGGGDNQWSTCMDDSFLDKDWGEVTWNPITWVRAVVYWMVSPIICAIWWLLVPQGGFGTIIDIFKEAFDDSPMMEALGSIADGFTWNSGCAPYDFGDPLGDMGPALGVIDVGMCGNLVIAVVWVALLGLAVLGMAGDLVRTLWTYGQYRKVNFYG